VLNRPSRLSQKWNILPFALAPSRGELLVLLAALVDRFGERSACRLLGVPVQTVRCWAASRRPPPASAARLIWLVHALLLRPGIVTSAFDLVTWGRFRVERQAVTRPSAEWTDYEI